MNRAKVFIGAVLAVALVAGLYWVNRYWIVPAATRQVKVSGDHPLAPTLLLTDLSGQKLSLADYKGKVVMLDFWATWCGPCLVEIPGFVKLQDHYRDQGFRIVGISMDDGPEPVRDFVKKFKMNYPVAMGDGKLGETFGGILGLPTTFLIGRDGRIYAKHIGATGVSVFEEEIKKLLAAEAQSEVGEFKQLGREGTVEKIELGDPAEIDSEVPGVNLSKLTAAQKEDFKKQITGQACDCGCKFNVLECRVKDRSCGISRKLAREHLAKFLKTPA